MIPNSFSSIVGVKFVLLTAALNPSMTFFTKFLRNSQSTSDCDFKKQLPFCSIPCDGRLRVV